MDQASVLPAASCERNPAALRTSSSCSQSADQSRIAAPPPARSAPQSEPHAVPSNRDPRPSSLALCQIEGKGYLLPDFYSGATGRPGRFSEGLLLRRLHKGGKALEQVFCVEHRKPSGTAERQISLDVLQHQRTSGQGCAICFRSVTSALA